MIGKRLETCRVPISVVGCGSAGRRIVGNLLEEGLDPALLTLYDSALAPPVAGVLKPLRMPPYPQKLIGAPGGVVFVATPMVAHASVLEQVIPECALVFVEKPACHAAHEERMLRAAQWPVLVGYNWRFHPCAALFQNEIATLSASERAKLTLSAKCFTDMRTWPGAWYGHPLYECSHEMDLAYFLLGPFEVIASKRREDVWNVVLSHSSGALTHIEIRHQSTSYLRQLSLSTGLDWKTNNFTRAGSSLPESLVREWSPDWMYRDCVVAAVQLVHSVAGLNRASCTLAEALRVVGECERAIKMAGYDSGASF